MNVDFAALGGTAWTVGGAMIIACMRSPTSLTYNLTAYKMELHELAQPFSKKFEMLFSQMSPRKQLDGLPAMSSSIYFVWISISTW